MTVRRWALLVLAVPALLFAACQSDDGATPDCPTAVDDAGVLDPSNPCLTQVGDVRNATLPDGDSDSGSD
jgi:hypothetical protein